MHMITKKTKKNKIIYYCFGLPIFRTRPSARDIAQEALQKIKKLEYCLLPEIQTIPQPQGVLHDLQTANFKILAAVADFCEKHNLRYWLDCGTLLGAVRHQNCIPWDDDIDIGMLRGDYDKLIEIFNKEMSDSDLRLNLYSSKSGFCNMVKIQHKDIPETWIDVFPYELYTQKVETWAEKIKLTRQVQNITRQNRKRFKGKDIEAFHQRLRKVHFEQVMQNKPAAPEKEHPAIFPSCDYMHQPKYSFFKDYETIFPLKTIKYNGKKFSCPQDIDTYLTADYGDYMSYPKNMENVHTDISKMSIESILAIKKYIKQ